jgi:hypothetical protein
MHTRTGLKALLTGAALWMASAGSYAGTVSCSGTTGGIAWDISQNVSGSSNCLILEPINGAINDTTTPPLTVNAAEFFGYNTWQYSGKFDDIPTGSGSSSFQTPYVGFSGNGQSGTYSFDENKPLDYQFMFVLKDGANTNLVAYLMSPSTMSGTYSSPFTSPPFLNNEGEFFTGAKDVSHISVYYITDPGGPGTGVPEPGTAAILGLGLLGMGLLSSRRKSRQH